MSKDAPIARSNPLVALFRSVSRDSNSDQATAASASPAPRSSKARKATATTTTSVPPPKRPRGAIEDPFPVYSSHASDYTLGEPIGYGASSIVYAAKFIPLDIPCAVKVIEVDRLSVSHIDRLRRETQLMSLSKHPNVLRVRGEWLHGSKLFIATRLMSSGSLADVMRYAHPDGFDEATIATILKQALEGLLYFHRNGWLHRDLKAGNMLVDEDGTVLLADFGVSSFHVATAVGQKVTQARKSFVGTPLYMAPEVIEQRNYDAKADVWSFGITALELSTGHAPHAFIPAAKVLQRTVLEEAPTVESDGRFSKSFKDLVDSCLRKDPSKRPSSEKLLSHPFFKQAKRKGHLVTEVLAGLPPLQVRQDRRRTASVASAGLSGSWTFDTVHSAKGDPFASFPGRHSPHTPPDSPHGSQHFDPAYAPVSARRHGRSISFSLPDSAPATASPLGSGLALPEVDEPSTEAGSEKVALPAADERPTVLIQAPPTPPKTKDKRTSRFGLAKLGFR